MKITNKAWISRGLPPLRSGRLGREVVGGGEAMTRGSIHLLPRDTQIVPHRELQTIHTKLKEKTKKTKDNADGVAIG